MTADPKYREPKVVKRIAEFTSLGFDATRIAKELSKEFKATFHVPTLIRVIKSLKIKTTEFLKADDKFKEVYKEVLNEILIKARKNFKILEETREIVLNQLRKIKESGVLESTVYTNDIYKAIRTQNDTIRATTEILKRLEVPDRETEVSAVQSVQATIENLQELEKQGYITIHRDFYLKTESGITQAKKLLKKDRDALSKMELKKVENGK